MVVLVLRLGQFDDAGLRTIGHEVARYAARGTLSRHKLRRLVRLRPCLLSLPQSVWAERFKVLTLNERRIHS